MSTKVPSTVVPYPPVPGTPGGVGTFFPGHQYASSTLLNGLIHYWPLSETSGQRNDVVGTTHLTDNNTVGYDSGKNGNCASFITANVEYLSTVTPADMKERQDRSFSFWFFRGATGVATRGLLSFGRTPTEGEAHIIIMQNNADIRFYHIGTYRVTSALSAGWHHVAHTYTQSTGDWTFVLDGVVSSGTNADSPAPNYFDDNFYIGSSFNTTFDSLIDEVAWWNRPLTSVEIASLYNAGSGRFHPSF